MSQTPQDKYKAVERYIRELPEDELKTAIFASVIAMIEALDASNRRANAHADREGWLEQNAGFRPVATPPEGSQWEIVIPAVYSNGKFCVPDKNGKPVGTSGAVLMRYTNDTSLEAPAP